MNLFLFRVALFCRPVGWVLSPLHEADKSLFNNATSQASNLRPLFSNFQDARSSDQPTGLCAFSFFFNYAVDPHLYTTSYSQTCPIKHAIRDENQLQISNLTKIMLRVCICVIFVDIKIHTPKTTGCFALHLFFFALVTKISVYMYRILLLSLLTMFGYFFQCAFRHPPIVAQVLVK